MAELKLTAKQYLGVMRALAAAMTLDEHAADDGKSDAELADLWDDLMDKAEDFGMSLPPEDDTARHWGDAMFAEADDTLHEFMEDEFTHLLATRLAGDEHTRQCARAEHEEEPCRGDFVARTMLWEERLGEEGALEQLLHATEDEA